MGTVYNVGDSAGWTNTGHVDYKTWSSTKNFYVGDTIVFEYNKQLQNVVRVTHKNFHACNATSPHAVYATGNDSFAASKPSHFFFICSLPGHCEAGQKVDIRVVGPRPVAPTPVPSWAPHQAPAPAPRVLSPLPSPITLTPAPTLAPTPTPYVPSSSWSPSPSTMPSPLAPTPAPAPSPLAPSPAPLAPTPAPASTTNVPLPSPSVPTPAVSPTPDIPSDLSPSPSAPNSPPPHHSGSNFLLSELLLTSKLRWLCLMVVGCWISAGIGF
ncbi:hypothetical protein LguiB_000245 [Lonicera macranthoides]